MYATNFEYDGKFLSDFGCMICTFGSSDFETVDNGSVISFSTVTALDGSKYMLSSSSYDGYLESTIQICKSRKDNILHEFTVEEFRRLAKWLNRKQFHKLRFISEDYIDIYFEASFNINRIEIAGKIVGLELNIITNRPFGKQEFDEIDISGSTENWEYLIFDTSDDEGFNYAKLTITINQSGNLSIYNAIEDRTTYVANCTQGEVITMEYPFITSSLASHKIQNDFNWNFFRLANTVDNIMNEITVSLPCDIVLSYSPTVKIGL